MRVKNMMKYWENQSKHFLNSDDEGFGAVIYSGMPVWFNAFYDHFQKKAFYKLVGNSISKDRRALDIGCGIGRWCFRLKSLGAIAYGIDFEIARLKKAKSNPSAKGIIFREMSASNLLFKNNFFDFCNSITVLHHIPYEEKSRAIKEICRVTKKGGRISIIELINTHDSAPHVFPWPLKKWQDEFEKNGCKLIKTIGVEYAPLPRALRSIKYHLGARQETIKRESSRVNLNKLEWIILRIAILLSYPIEAFCTKVLPPRFAQQGGLLFIKE
jgi:ubiquinone/menaquinone biosynthesis C-methylase UbiE